MRDIVAALQDYATHPIVLRQVPIRDGDRVVGAVDLVSERAWSYREGQPSTLIEIPAGMLEREHEARDGMLEHLSELRRPPARGADRGQGAAERRGLRALRPGARREPGDRGADRLGPARQRHRAGVEGAAPRGAAAGGAARPAAGAGGSRRAAGGGDRRRRLPQAHGQDPAPARARALAVLAPARRPGAGPADPGRPARHPSDARGARGRDRHRGQVRPPDARHARHQRRAARGAGLAPAAAAAAVPAVRARPTSATTSSSPARWRRSPRATRRSWSARTRRPAGRWSGRRGRCTCGCCASG